MAANRRCCSLVATCRAIVAVQSVLLLVGSIAGIVILNNVVSSAAYLATLDGALCSVPVNEVQVSCRSLNLVLNAWFAGELICAVTGVLAAFFRQSFLVFVFGFYTVVFMATSIAMAYGSYAVQSRWPFSLIATSTSVAHLLALTSVVAWRMSSGKRPSLVPSR